MAQVQAPVQRYVPPTSGEILGVVARLLEPKPALLRDRQASRMFNGEIVTQKQRQKVFAAMAIALLDSELLPRDAFQGLPLAADELLARVISWHATKWDRLRGQVYQSSGRVVDPGEIVMAYLRLVAVDLAVRGVAFLCLVDVPEPGEAAPAWARERGVAHALREMLASAQLTREELAIKIEVSDNTVDDWLDRGTRPSPRHISRITRTLSATIPDGSAGLSVPYLAQMYFLSAMADRLADRVGRPGVEMLAQGLAALIARVLPDIRATQPSGIERVTTVHLQTLLMGCEAPRSKPLLRLMWRQEGNSGWRTVIQAAGLDWLRWIQHETAEHGTPDSEGPVMHASALSAQVHEILNALVAETFETEFEGDNDVARRVREKMVALLRTALEQDSTDAWLHFQLGSVLDELGFVDEALQECWVAHELEPEWLLPLSEIGVICLNAGRDEEALRHLEEAAACADDPPWNVLLNLGVARVRQGNVEGGLEALERSLEEEPNHPKTLKVAAACAWELGHKPKARRYQKRALLMGGG